VQLVIVQDSCQVAHSNFSAERDRITTKDCCGSGMFIPDPGSASKNLRILIFNPKHCI
jgi:hypothetical protein